MLRHAPLLLLVSLHAEAAAQSVVSLVRPFDVGISSAFDTVRRRLVLFGDDGATWELAGGELLRRADLTGVATPPPRLRPAMCFDEARRRVLMFGGQAASIGSPLGDTWSYDGSRWTQLVGGPSPGARVDAAITWDAVRNRVLLWGGQLGGPHTDTWEHDGAAWSLRTPATIPGPNSGRMTFDRQRGVAVLVVPSPTFGGTTDTWEWNGSNWSLRTTNGPASNANATLAFDPLRNRTVLVGGIPNTGVHEWDGAAWTTVALPQPFRRLNAASWFDPDAGCVAIVGGTDWEAAIGGGTQQGPAHADRWHWNGQALTLVHDDVGPLAAFNTALIPDPPRGRVVHFGGLLPGGVPTATTWSWTGQAWTAVSSAASPGARASAAAAFDPTLGEGLLFGGSSSGVYLGDTWSLGANGWVARSTTGPAPRAGAVMTCDLQRGVVVLFGGATAAPFTPGSLRDDTWEWNGAAWTQRVATVRPGARFDAAMAFHPQLGKVVLYGGRVDATAAGQLGDTWTWDGAQWQQLTPATVPPALLTPTLSTDLPTGTCTLVGHARPQNVWHHQVWTHDGANWLLRLDEPAPVVNRWGPCVPGPGFDRLLCAGRGAMVAEVVLQPALVATLGNGCGAPASVLVARSRPRLGATTGLELVANPNRAAVFALALTAGNTPIGNGCSLWIGPLCLTLFQPTGAAGFAEQLLALPADRALLGVNLFAQAAVLEPQMPNGLVLTQGLRLTLGD